MTTRLEQIPGPNRDPTTPRIALPRMACDSHVHVFGPHDRFPYAADRTFTPEDVPLEDLIALHSRLGLDRAIIVQSLCYGSDHSALTDALIRGAGRYRGVALVDAQTTPRQIEEWHDLGMRGARIHFTSPDSSPAPDDLERIVDLIGPHGWHLDVHTIGEGIIRFSGMFDSIPLRIVIDHMGRLRLDSADFSEQKGLLLGLLDTGQVWVKLSAADRIARFPPSLDDALSLGRELFLRRKNRCVWGTDFPHPNVDGFMPDDGKLVDGLLSICDTPEDLRMLLVSNPETCFDFPPPA